MVTLRKLTTSCLASSRHGRIPRTALGVLATALLLLHGAAPARAGLTLDLIVQNSSTAVGSSTGTFDVILQNDATSTESVTIGGFALDLTVPVGSGITFTGATNATTTTYIFSSSFLGYSAPIPNPSEIQPNDTAAVLSEQLLTPGGQAYGLAHVSYSVASNANQTPVTVTLVDLGGATSLSTSTGNLVPVSSLNVTNGQITVNGINPVPEPSTIMMTATGGMATVLGLLMRRWKERSLRLPGHTETL
jgi:hypothetical protein